MAIKQNLSDQSSSESDMPSLEESVDSDSDFISRTEKVPTATPATSLQPVVAKLTSSQESDSESSYELPARESDEEYSESSDQDISQFEYLDSEDSDSGSGDEWDEKSFVYNLSEPHSENDFLKYQKWSYKEDLKLEKDTFKKPSLSDAKPKLQKSARDEEAEGRREKVEITLSTKEKKMRMQERKNRRMKKREQEIDEKRLKKEMFLKESLARASNLAIKKKWDQAYDLFNICLGSSFSKLIKIYNYNLLRYLANYAFMESKPSRLLDAIDVFKGLAKDIGTDFPLVYLGLGEAFLKNHEYEKAADSLRKGLERVESKEFEPMNWPAMEEIMPTSVHETLVNELRDALARAFNPKPDLICSAESCKVQLTKAKSSRFIYWSQHAKSKLYFKLECSHKCQLGFHETCWKKIVNEKNKLAGDREADMILNIDQNCPTKDCGGTICKITKLDGTGHEIESYNHIISKKSKKLMKSHAEDDNATRHVENKSPSNRQEINKIEVKATAEVLSTTPVDGDLQKPYYTYPNSCIDHIEQDWVQAILKLSEEPQQQQSQANFDDVLERELQKPENYRWAGYPKPPSAIELPPSVTTEDIDTGRILVINPKQDQIKQDQAMRVLAKHKKKAKYKAETNTTLINRTSTTLRKKKKIVYKPFDFGRSSTPKDRDKGKGKDKDKGKDKEKYVPIAEELEDKDNKELQLALQESLTIGSASPYSTYHISKIGESSQSSNHRMIPEIPVDTGYSDNEIL